MDDVTCSAPGCGKRKSAKGFCPMHYQRWKRHGDPQTVLPRPARGDHYVANDEPLTCKKCGRVKRADAFPVVKDNRNGRSGSCKRCHADKAIARWHAKPEVRAREREWKAAYFAENPDVRRAQTQRYYERHRKSIQERVRARARLNRVTIRAKNAEYRARPGVLEKAALAARAWRLANPERAKELNKTVQLRRRARLREAPLAPFTPEQLRARLDYFSHCCWMCRAPYDHIDHVKPIAAGGAHMLANLRPACAACNLSKGRKWGGADWTLTLVK